MGETNDTEIDLTDLNVMREAGIKQAMAEGLKIAGGAWKLAAICRASMNPEIAALAPLYETIAETWALHACRVMECSPPISPPKAST